MAEVEIPFLEEFRDRMLSGRKTATTRTRRYGYPGDIFWFGLRKFELLEVEKVFLGHVAQDEFEIEGFKSQEDFIECWNRIHPRKTYDKNQLVWLHTFRRIA